jgi:branched-chain amino acid transport system substrate-binding protein
MHKLFKVLSAGLALCLLVACLSGCGAKGGDDVIKIGYIGALSGETAVWGQAGLNGMNLTAKEINEAGGILGKQVVVVGMDGMGQPADSVNALNRLIDEEKVLAVVGTTSRAARLLWFPSPTRNRSP